jgi:hypothetical protein
MVSMRSILILVSVELSVVVIPVSLIVAMVPKNLVVCVRIWKKMELLSGAIIKIRELYNGT